MASVPRLLENLDNPAGVKGVYYRDGDRVCFSGAAERPDLDSFPEFPFRQLPVAAYSNGPLSVGVLSKAGCVFGCAYCTYPSVSGREIQVRSPKLIVDDIERLVSEYSLESFFFVDSVFNYPPEHAKAVCEEIVRREIKVRWRAYFVEKYMDRSLMEEAVRAGCDCFELSPDGAVQATMNALGKMNTEGDVERVIDLVKQCDGARASMGFMVNPPKQSISALRKLVGLFIKTKARYPEKFLHVKAWYPRIYPRTPLHSYLTERTDFPKTEADLLPRNAADLKRTFWINADNSYVNLAYNLLSRDYLYNQIEVGSSRLYVLFEAASG